MYDLVQAAPAITIFRNTNKTEFGPNEVDICTFLLQKSNPVTVSSERKLSLLDCETQFSLEQNRKQTKSGLNSQSHNWPFQEVQI